jgi:hypothetical protein
MPHERPLSDPQAEAPLAPVARVAGTAAHIYQHLAVASERRG